MSVRFVSKQQAVALIDDESVVAVDGFCMMAVPGGILHEIEGSFLAGNGPNSLVLVHAAGLDVGAAVGAAAIIPQSSQFNFYSGGGLDTTFLGAGHVDAAGNVNVSLLGPRVIGVGEFIDIVAGAKRICFCFTSSGRRSKWVSKVDHVSFEASQAIAQSQEVFYLTEDATLQPTPGGLEVVYLAEGVGLSDLQLPFEVVISPDMDHG